MTTLLSALATTVLLTASFSGPEIRWRAPAGCPSEREVRRRIAGLLSDAPPGPALRVEAVVRRTEEATLRLDVTIHDGEGQSVRPPVESSLCGELAEALGLHLDALWRARAREPAPRPRRRPDGGLRLAPLVGVGAIKSVKRLGADGVPEAYGSTAFYGGEAVAFIDWRRARVELGVAGDATARRVEDRAPVWWWRLQGSIRGCGRLRRRALALQLCGGISGGYMTSKGGRGASPWTLEAQLGPALTWWVHRHVGVWVGARGSARILAHSEGAEGWERCRWRDPCPDFPYVGFGGGAGVEFRWGP
ncbi:MAG: hypothetical protein H6711_09540 [Myxococcales bacterium]|nr:hypothetical protein [Myxococcales bacterium]